jgi:hypothetical protein
MPCASHPPYVDSFELLISTEGHGERVMTVPPTACSGPNWSPLYPFFSHYFRPDLTGGYVSFQICDE